MSRSQFSSYKTLSRLLLVLVLGLAVSFAACDSGGSNEEDSDNGDDGRDVEQTFSVGVVQTNDDYAYSNDNTIGVAYAIGGAMDTGTPVITLERGKTYEFSLESSVDSGPNDASHPFYVGESATGGGADQYTDGVENDMSSSGSVYFTPPSNAPSTLYLECGSHQFMGAEIEIIDGSSSGAEGGDPDY